MIAFCKKSLQMKPLLTSQIIGLSIIFYLQSRFILDHSIKSSFKLLVFLFVTNFRNLDESVPPQHSFWKSSCETAKCAKDLLNSVSFCWKHLFVCRTVKNMKRNYFCLQFYIRFSWNRKSDFSLEKPLYPLSIFAFRFCWVFIVPFIIVNFNSNLLAFELRALYETVAVFSSQKGAIWFFF